MAFCCLTPRLELQFNLKTLIMKTKILKSSILVAIFAVAIFACNKQEEVINTTESSPIEPSFAQQGPYIKMTGTIRRAVEKRKRDNKVCDCLECFGVCNISFKVGWKPKMYAAPPVSNGNGGHSTRIYFNNDLDQFEDEFGIDFDLDIPNEFLENTGYNSFTLKAGLYNFQEIGGNLNDNGEDVQTFGYVDVDCVFN